jgi:hypothetical protein
MELVLAVLIALAVAAFVSVPLRRAARASEPGEVDAEAALADLEARKQAKYREIRDAEADHAAGKLTDEDFARLDRELRAEAIELLKELDSLSERRG